MPVAILESARSLVRDRASVDPDDIYQISSPADNALLQSTLDSPSGSPSGLDWVSTEVELEASDILLLLAKGNHAFSNSSSTSGPEGKLARGNNCNVEEVIKGEYDDKIRLMVSKKQKMESSPPDKKVKRESSQADRAYTTTVRDGKGKRKMDEFQGCDEDDKGYSHEAESNCEDVEYKVTKYQLELSILVEKEVLEKEVEKKKRKQSSRNSVSRKISKTSQRFKCNICNKSFSTHQALGSHMSSHSKVTIKKSQSGDDHEVDNERSPADQEADESALIAAATQEADGGADAECGGESGDGAPQASGCKRLVIDLNELPPMEEDEQEG
ncbi:zinc finger protein ZAT1-like [Syzygium oleosum]|uniref:zinc finger protein ZAT1-like n=1 Tax=Syzygium oleosum TaxID=219896 RepID=UPI0011D26D30|nr:zinc finger protein ZAT1-like [Syzygium oleosum]